MVREHAPQEAVVEFTGPVDGQLAGAILEGKLGIVDHNAFGLYDKTGRAYRIPFEQARSVSLTDRKMGAVRGLWIGAIPGAVGGALLGSAAASMCGGMGEAYSRCNTGDSVGTVAVGTAFGAALGAMVGAGIGLLTGHHKTFKSEDQYDSPQPEVPIQPAEGSRCRCEGNIGR